MLCARMHTKDGTFIPNVRYTENESLESGGQERSLAAIEPTKHSIVCKNHFSETDYIGTTTSGMFI